MCAHRPVRCTDFCLRHTLLIVCARSHCTLPPRSTHALASWRSPCNLCLLVLQLAVWARHVTWVITQLLWFVSAVSCHSTAPPLNWHADGFRFRFCRPTTFLLSKQLVGQVVRCTHWPHRPCALCMWVGGVSGFVVDLLTCRFGFVVVNVLTRSTFFVTAGTSPLAGFSTLNINSHCLLVAPCHSMDLPTWTFILCHPR